MDKTTAQQALASAEAIYQQAEEAVASADDTLNGFGFSLPREKAQREAVLVEFRVQHNVYREAVVARERAREAFFEAYATREDACEGV